jgi:hypothetical protein
MSKKNLIEELAIVELEQRVEFGCCGGGGGGGGDTPPGGGCGGTGDECDPE